MIPSERQLGLTLEVAEQLHKCFLVVLYYSKSCFSILVSCFCFFFFFPTDHKAYAVLYPGYMSLTDNLIFHSQFFSISATEDPLLQLQVEKIFVADLALPVIIYECDVLTCLLCAYIELLQ